MVASILIAPSTGNALGTTGLVSWWTCDETSGVRYDSHGVNDLTDNNTVTYQTGKISNACEFTWTNSEYLSITDASQSGLDFSTAFSFSYWTYMDNNANTDYALISKRAETAGTNAYLIYLSGAANTFYTYLSGDGTAETAKSVTWNPSASTWYHVVVTYDAGTTKYYVDGAQVGSTQTGSPASLYNNSQPFRIGVTNVSDADYDGHLDEISAWNIALTASSVEELYNAGAGITYTDLESTTTSTTTTATTTSDIDIDTLQWTIELYLSMFSFLIFTYLGYRFTKFFI